MSIDERLEKIEAMLTVLVERQTVREWYSTDEFARLVGKADFTVREWCRLGRVRASKRGSGRGAFPAWVISHQELLRYQREGLLPLRHFWLHLRETTPYHTGRSRNRSCGLRTIPEDQTGGANSNAAAT